MLESLSHFSLCVGIAGTCFFGSGILESSSVFAHVTEGTIEAAIPSRQSIYLSQMNLAEAMGQTSTPKKSEETTTVPQQVRQTSESETEIEDTSERPSIEDAMRRIQQESSDSTTKTEENTEDNRTE